MQENGGGDESEKPLNLLRRRWSMSHPPSNEQLAPPRAPSSIYKHKSWSPDFLRDEAWQRRQDRRHRRSKSVTNDDMEELKACIELGFGFDSPEMDQRLSDTLPAYGLYYAVNKQYNRSVSKAPVPMSPSTSECETPSPLGSPLTIISHEDNPQTVKTRLKQWAQVVGCAVRQTTR